MIVPPLENISVLGVYSLKNTLSKLCGNNTPSLSEAN